MKNKGLRLFVSILSLVCLIPSLIGCSGTAEVQPDDSKIVVETEESAEESGPVIEVGELDNFVVNGEDTTTTNLGEIADGSEVPLDMDDDDDKDDEDEKDDKDDEDDDDDDDDEDKGPLKTEDGKIIVDLVFFAGQSNMSGAGGNADYAPKVEEGHGYEFRTISDPTRLYPIVEPFGLNENAPLSIMDFPGGRKGSIVSAFANKYYEETGVPIVAVSASAGGTNTSFWLSAPVVADLEERRKRAQVWLESNDYYIRKQYVVWLQGESDAIVGVTSEQYNQNMDNIIRPLFIGGVQKVFFITPGRTIGRNQYFNDVIAAQLSMSKNSGYYGLATTILSAVSTEYMVDEWHYNQTVLNLVGEEAAKSVAYYTNNRREACVYDYKNGTTFIPDGFDYTGDEEVKPLDVNGGGYLQVIPAK